MIPKIKIFENGIRFISVPLKDATTATALVLVNVGSANEIKEQAGISHFLEHMFFKGSKKWPSSLSLSRVIDSLGAEHNAFTGQEFTGFYVKSSSNNFSKAIDILGDVFLNPILPEDEMEKEKGVIIEEINMYEDMPADKVKEVLMATLYGENALGRSVAGNKESVLGIHRQDLFNYFSSNYLSESVVIVISGGFGQDEEVQTESIFSKVAIGKSKSRLKVDEKQTEPILNIFNKQSDQLHLVLAMRSSGIFDKRQPILKVLSAIIGGSPSSRLFQLLREKLGVAYYVGASQNSFSDCGFLSISAGIHKEKSDIVVSAILSELKDLTEEKVSVEELKNVKSFMTGRFFLNLESSDEVAEFFGLREISGKELVLPKDVANEIEKVTAEQILEVTRDIFRNDNLNLAIVGPALKEKIKPVLKL